ncbi:hypothetical protein BCR36DRAFT_367738 [Piromyces finnis]|uniref:ABC transmembrane type-1 domain-containing protein n=1 Tax=Piromyces finnis TaxID=1754191 RepID=A0A1Y1VGX0_9FUNG|nr:hypothetical protein BCR36DRAFT_367738 [Piromyces finnis]|eukprot:ORX55900.1 hypothetical protein BCR36DRAFT_367738 [Piromyces finnis]
MSNNSINISTNENDINKESNTIDDNKNNNDSKINVVNDSKNNSELNIPDKSTNSSNVNNDENINISNGSNDNFKLNDNIINENDCNNKSYESNINQITSNPDTLVENSSNENLQGKKVVIQDEIYVDDENDEESIKDQNNGKKKVSFFGLFRYSTKLEKIMIFIGLLGAICQGATLPLMYS